MDQREEHAIQLEMMWTVKHGKDKHHNRLRNRLTDWMWEDEDATPQEEVIHAGKRSYLSTRGARRLPAAKKHEQGSSKSAGSG